MRQSLSHVVFIAFEDFDNLGIGYLCSTLSDAGYKTKLISFRKKKGDILKTLKRLNPLIIGFSVIFQHHIYKFQRLVSYLRNNGVQCHFTAGGHYASLKYDELLKIIPEFDSIVRFEGEYTILDLVRRIYSGKEWRKIAGIAYKEKNEVIVNPLRPLEKDLDKFPFPKRSAPAEYGFNRKFATILAGRGCIHDCLFCNIKEYYKQSSGPYKRVRTPENVVKEMEFLYREKECSIFLFQDDDFPVRTNNGPDWIIKFCKELKRTGLKENIMWKINCRPDEIDEESFKMMKDHGLYLIFMGVEDGTDSGLKRINKHITAAKNIEGINILKKLEIGFDFGFMLFQPWSTFKSINKNLDFLRQICGDGYTPAVFLKMLPYFATGIERELQKERRLKGQPGFLDYDFYEEPLNQYYDFVMECFSEWLSDQDGLVNNSKWIRNYFLVCKRYFDLSPKVSSLNRNVRSVISESNLFLLSTMQELSGIFESGLSKRFMNQTLKDYRHSVKSRHELFQEQINNAIVKLYHFAGIPYYVF